MKKLKKFEEYDNNNNDLSGAEFWVNKFGIDIEVAEQLEELIEEILATDDIDERMDIVEEFVFFLLIDDEELADKIEEYIKDVYVIQ
jgi:hypothetical protein